jgi:hypothetical protein
MVKTRVEGAGTSKTASTYWITLNWEGSSMMSDELKGLASAGLLPKKKDGLWHAPGNEVRPTPREGERISFMSHVEHGLTPAGSRFIRELLVFTTSGSMT